MKTFQFVQSQDYRRDIDGLRAIAVLAVIAFHFGCLPNGFLGVDIFFVISGYLISGIIYKEINETRFSLKNFYLRRIRRIIPLTLFISALSLIIGVVTMLPNDLKTLSQSVIATSFFSNNILQAVTTKNYWDVVNEYKPLMHTWSLGIEEQYYLLYPFLFLIISKKNPTWILPLLIILTIASVFCFFLPYDEYYKFYFLPFRFYELSIGGIMAISLNNKLIVHKYSPLFLFALILMLCSELNTVPHPVILITTTLLTIGVIISSDQITSFILENKLLVGVGTISFSLYMWHQVILSYTRYFIYQELRTIHLVFISIFIFILSILTYYLIEEPCRNKTKIKTKHLLLILSIAFGLVNLSAFYIEHKGGILEQVPELNITEANIHEHMPGIYSNRIDHYDNNFKSKNLTKILIIGNSFARDWANVLLESKYKNIIEISYIRDPSNHPELKKRIKKANIIFLCSDNVLTHAEVNPLHITKNKLYIVGTKNFGSSNGIFYNYKGNDYCSQKTLMINGFIEKNTYAKKEWGNRYIDIIGEIIDAEQKVPVFTPDCKFISQDNRHLTQEGAAYFAQIFEKKLKHLIKLKPAQIKMTA
jgi:peptidoglycan/LPS O-acetylase OafA/YrhL